MLGLPASDKAPALAATGGRAVAQLKTPWSLDIVLALVFLVTQQERILGVKM